MKLATFLEKIAELHCRNTNQAFETAQQRHNAFVAELTWLAGVTVPEMLVEPPEESSIPRADYAALRRSDHFFTTEEKIA